MSSHCLLASVVSDEKSSVCVTEALLLMTSCLSLAPFRIFSCSPHFDIFTMMCLWLCVDILACILYPTLSSRSSLGMKTTICHQTWELFSRSLFKYFSFPLISTSGPPVTHLLANLMMSHVSVRLCSLLYFLSVLQTG